MFRELIREINKQRFHHYLQGFTFNIEKSFKKTFKWPGPLLHLFAILISLPIVYYGIDWAYFKFFAKYKYLQIFMFPAVSLGGLIPLLFPPMIYLHAKREDKPYLEPLAFSLTQAAVVGVFWASIYKAFSGRTGPELFEDFDGDYSQEFAFGFLRTGVFDGWPSAHTSIAWAMAVVFFLYRPEKNIENKIELEEIPRILNYRKYGFIYAFYVGFGVSTNIHWLSDAVAGVLIGISVGLAVSGTFSSQWKSEKIIGNASMTKIYVVLFLVFLLIVFSIFGFDDL